MTDEDAIFDFVSTASAILSPLDRVENKTRQCQKSRAEGWRNRSGGYRHCPVRRNRLFGGFLCNTQRLGKNLADFSRRIFIGIIAAGYSVS